MTSMASVGIVIVNWNDYENTANCLKSLSSISYSDYDIYLVDNASDSDSYAKLCDEFPAVNFLRNNINRGFAGGCNSGIRAAINDGCEYILLLNNDTIVTPEFLTPLVQTARERERAAIVGGKIYQISNNSVWYSGGKMSRFTGKPSHIHEDREGVFETDFVTGCLMLLTRDFLKEQGNLVEDYFLYYEDVEISCRAQRSGWELYVNCSSIIHHDCGGSTDEAETASPTRAYYATRNRFKFLRSYGRYNMLGGFIYSLILPAVLFIWWRGSGPDSVLAGLRGFFDGMRGRDGRHRKYP